MGNSKPGHEKVSVNQLVTQWCAHKYELFCDILHWLSFLWYISKYYLHMALQTSSQHL